MTAPLGAICELAPAGCRTRRARVIGFRGVSVHDADRDTLEVIAAGDADADATAAGAVDEERTAGQRPSDRHPLSSALAGDPGDGARAGPRRGGN